jgi:NAD(P) transhydrogenase
MKLLHHKYTRTRNRCQTALRQGRGETNLASNTPMESEGAIIIPVTAFRWSKQLRARSEHMTISPYDYDIFVIGCGPAGLHASLQAARFGQRVGVVDPIRFQGDDYIDMGSITSKTIREVVLVSNSPRRHLLNLNQAEHANNLSIDDFISGIQMVSRYEQDANIRLLRANGINMLPGKASFLDSHSLTVESVGGVKQTVSAEKVIIAVGSDVDREPHLPIDGVTIFTHEDILAVGEFPARLAILGGGIIGLEYACIFQRMGVAVTLIDQRERLLPGVDAEIVDTLLYALRKNGMIILLGDDIERVEIIHSQSPVVHVTLASGERLIVDKMMINLGRKGSTRILNLPAAGIVVNEHDFIPVNSQYQTFVGHIYAVGDVTGYPHLASIAMEQGRRAALHASAPGEYEALVDVPKGIYTIPEIASVGKTEEELKQTETPYIAGYARYRDLAKGLMVGDEVGLMKILFDPTTHKMFGVHIIGEGASEIIHTGKAVIALGGKLDYFTQAVINYPSLTECYRMAALDGLSKLRNLTVGRTG